MARPAPCGRQIRLQLVGLETMIVAMGISGQLGPIIITVSVIAFVVIVPYTY